MYELNINNSLCLNVDLGFVSVGGKICFTFLWTYEDGKPRPLVFLMLFKYMKCQF